MALEEILAADIQAAAEELDKRDPERKLADDVSNAIRLTAAAGHSGTLTVPNRMADQVRELLKPKTAKRPAADGPPATD